MCAALLGRNLGVELLHHEVCIYSTFMKLPEFLQHGLINSQECFKVPVSPHPHQHLTYFFILDILAGVILSFVYCTFLILYSNLPIFLTVLRTCHIRLQFEAIFVWGSCLDSLSAIFPPI